MMINSGYRLEVKAGQDNHFSLELRNVGITTMDNIRLSSDYISDWTIDLSPVEIASLSPGNIQIIDVNIRPTSKPSGKVHYIRFFATSGAFQTVQSFEVEVKTAPVWLWVVIGFAVLVIAVFVVIFLKVGRRG